MRVVDQGVSPGRHFDLARLVARRVVVGVGVVPEAERAGVFFADPLRSRHFLQRASQLFGIANVEIEPPPGARLGSQFSERQPFEPRLDRQQGKRRGGVACPAQLDRAHRRSPRRGRKNAPARVGEENGVDQLRLAARKLGNEGDHQLLVGKPQPQGIDLIGDRAEGEFVLGQETCQGLEPHSELCTPAAEGVETVGKRMRHQGLSEQGKPW